MKQEALAIQPAQAQNTILRLTDDVSGRRCAVRIDARDAGATLRSLLDTYLKTPDLDSLLADGRITQQSEESLGALQELVYISSPGGDLGDVFPGIAFRQDSRPVGLDQEPEPRSAEVAKKQVGLIEIKIDRWGMGYDRDWRGFHRRRWAKRPDAYSAFVTSCLEQDYGVAGAQAVLQLETTGQKLQFVRSIGKAIWQSDFESYSRFTGRKLVYKTGDETLTNIIEGAGGICTEKVQALQFITDNYGLDSEVLFAGADTSEPAPEARLRRLLTNFDFSYSKRFMRYWQHTALLYRFGDKNVLVDATNGNIPYLFLEGREAERLLTYDGKEPVAVQMAMTPENFYYHRVSQDIPEKLFFAMEGWIAFVDLVQVFDNELGLYISSDFFISPLVFKSDRRFGRLRDAYADACRRAGLEYDVSAEWTLDSELGEQFAERHPRVSSAIMSSREHLLERYDQCHGPDHEAGLAIVRLKG